MTDGPLQIGIVTYMPSPLGPELSGVSGRLSRGVLVRIQAGTTQ